jgi:hypothetical protein
VESQARIRRENRRHEALAGGTVKFEASKVEEVQKQEIKKRLTKLNINASSEIPNASFSQSANISGHSSSSSSGGNASASRSRRKKAVMNVDNYSDPNILSSQSKDMLLMAARDPASIVKASTLIELAEAERKKARQERMKNETELRELRELVELLNSRPATVEGGII